MLFELVRRGALPEAEAAASTITSSSTKASCARRSSSPRSVMRSRSGGTVTLAGDHRQATDETAYFTGWDAARSASCARSAGRRSRSRSRIARSLRSASSRARSPTAPRALPAEPPRRSRGVGERVSGPARAGGRAVLAPRRAPDARSVAADRGHRAQRRSTRAACTRELSRGLDPTLVLDGDFRFEPGVIVTTAAAVSRPRVRLRRDPRLTPAFYPVTPQLTRALYVAATRARDWLWLLTPEAWSPLVAPSPVSSTEPRETAGDSRGP